MDCEHTHVVISSIDRSLSEFYGEVSGEYFTEAFLLCIEVLAHVLFKNASAHISPIEGRYRDGKL